MIEFLHTHKNKNLILFVHGFTGSENTWKNSSGKTFADILLADKIIIDNFDLAQYCYHTKLIESLGLNITRSFLKRIFLKTIKKIKKNLDIKSLADQMSSLIRFQCKDYQNIIIIAHSMGGLISKAFILKQIEQYGNTQVKLFLSLAVPHAGSNLANLGKYFLPSNVQLNDLTPLNDTITKLNREWLNISSPKTVYFLGQYDDVVPANSAVPLEPGKPDPVFCPDDHLTICKPESEQSIIYIATKQYLEDFINSQKFIQNQEITIFNDDGRYDNEIFVIKLLIADVHETLINSAKQSFFNAEYFVRTLNSSQLKCLEELYVKIKDLYAIYFGKLLSGDIKDSNELITKIHEKIRDDDKLVITNNNFKHIISLISHIHKTGMLHQRANIDQDILWAKHNSIKDIDKFLERKKLDA